MVYNLKIFQNGFFEFLKLNSTISLITVLKKNRYIIRHHSPKSLLCNPLIPLPCFQNITFNTKNKHSRNFWHTSLLILQNITIFMVILNTLTIAFIFKCQLFRVHWIQHKQNWPIHSLQHSSLNSSPLPISSCNSKEMLMTLSLSTWPKNI